VVAAPVKPAKPVHHAKKPAKDDIIDVFGKDKP
jgi:hypothetical protein